MFISKLVLSILVVYNYKVVYGDPVQNSVENHPNLSLLPESCGEISQHLSSLYSYPWLALISFERENTMEFLAGGTIINSRYILTAGHVVRQKTVAGVRIGDYDIKTLNDCVGSVCESHTQDIVVEKILLHDEFNTGNMVNDIALLRLKTPIDFSHKNAAPICLPVTQDLRKPLEDGKEALVAGWDLKSHNQTSVLSDIVSLVSKDTCMEDFKTSVKHLNLDKQLCARGYQNYCAISGFPLLVAKKNKNAERYFQYGIVTRGSRVCTTDSLVILTDVSKHINWILDNIKA